MKILIVSPKSKTLVNFRGDLIKDVISKGHEVIALGPEEDYKEEIEKIGAVYNIIKMDKNSTGITHDIKYMNALRKIMIKEKPDVVFSYTIKPVIYGTLAAKLANVPYIYPMLTGLGYAFTTKTLKAKIIKMIVSILYKFSLLFSTKVFFQNKDDLDYFVKQRFVKENKTILVNGSGVNLNKFTPKPIPKEISFLMIGRIMKNKGVIEYLKAAKIVKRKYPTVKLSLLGAIEEIQDSLTYEDIQPYIDDKTVNYIKETTDVRPYIEEASVFVLPSYREGTPRTVLESMAMGRPIITTNAPGCRDTVEDGKNGFLIPIQNYEELASKMIWMIEHPDEVKEMGQQSLNICKEKYDVVKVNKSMLKHMKL